MVGKHTFLVVGLMAAGGAPYLTSKTVTPTSGSAASSTAAQESVYRNAAAESTSTSSQQSANPFGGSYRFFGTQ